MTHIEEQWINEEQRKGEERGERRKEEWGCMNCRWAEWKRDIPYDGTIIGLCRHPCVEEVVNAVRRYGARKPPLVRKYASKMQWLPDDLGVTCRGREMIRPQIQPSDGGNDADNVVHPSEGVVSPGKVR